MALVSIIVPVYNTEQYIHRCLDSIICQTYHKIEIILVDDGSTDYSAEICDEYARTDTRIKVFHQENQGAALSRKFALGKTTGDYILMVDSDDWIEPTMVEEMLCLVNDKGLDVVWCDVMIQMRQSRFIHRIKYTDNPREMLKSIYQGQVPGWFWNKLIRRSLLEDLTVYKESVFEDVFFSTQLLLKSPRMGYLPKPFYNYNRANDAALTRNSAVFVNGVPNIQHCYDYLVQKRCLEAFKDSFSTLILRVKIDLINNQQYREAQAILPFAHLRLKNYPIAFPVSIIYWLGLNLGLLGRLLMTLYRSVA